MLPLYTFMGSKFLEHFPRVGWSLRLPGSPVGAHRGVSAIQNSKLSEEYHKAKKSEQETAAKASGLVAAK